MKTGVEKPVVGSVAGSLGVASMDKVPGIRSRPSSTMTSLLPAVRSPAYLVSVVAIGRKSPIGYRLSLLRERLPPVAGHRKAPPRESFRQRLVNASISGQPRRSVRADYV